MENSLEDALGSCNGSNHPKLVNNRHHAVAPVVRYASDYKMSHKRRGIAIILNHETFNIDSLKPRAGTMVDCENLTNSLGNLDFDVRVYKDLYLHEIKSHMDELSRMDHSDADCILVAIMSHGNLGYLYAKDCEYQLGTIWSCFTPDRCPTLAGKPKLFFIQACRGNKFDGGVTLRERTETDSDSTMSYSIPLYADFLIAYSTIEGFYSWREKTHGSWFMQSLCAELDQNGRKYDLLTLLTFVSQRVAINFESYVLDNPYEHQNKQIPCVTSMLTRVLTFSK